MVFYEKLWIIYLKLQEFENNDKLFGNANILLSGAIMHFQSIVTDVSCNNLDVK